MEEATGRILKQNLVSVFQGKMGKDVLDELIQVVVKSQAFLKRQSQGSTSFLLMLNQQAIKEGVEFEIKHIVETDFYKFDSNWLRNAILESGCSSCMFVEYVPIRSPFGGGFYEPDYLHLDRSITVCESVEVEAIGELRIIHYVESPKDWIN